MVGKLLTEVINTRKALKPDMKEAFKFISVSFGPFAQLLSSTRSVILVF